MTHRLPSQSLGIAATLAAPDVKFIDPNGGGPGVRLRENPA